jgi:predicted transposase YbfD/YdcC
MPSSPIPAARRQALLDLLSQVPDQRKERGRRHPLTGLLAVGIAAVTAGARSFAAIGQWAADAGPDVLAALGATRGAADESTYRRTFAQVSADTLDAALGAWLWTRAARVGGRMVIAVDGKSVRGAKKKGGKAPHLVAAMAHGIGTVLSQVAVDAKSNEIPAVRELLKAFAGLAGAVLTMDALHAQHDTAQAVLARHADYVMTVKANMPTLYSQLKKLPWKDVPAFSCVTKDHGRRARRTVRAVLAPAWVEFEGAAQVAQVRRTVNKLHWVATSPTRKTSPWSGPGTHPGSWPRSAASPSACCAWTAMPTSPLPTATMPTTPSAHSSYFKLNEYDFAGSLVSPRPGK